MKFCSKCNLEKDLIHFSVNQTKSDGLHSYCKECQNKYFAEYYSKNTEKHRKAIVRVRNNKKAAVAKYKLDRGCNRCGYSEHPAALQFHHLDPDEKSFNIGGSWGLPLEEILKEIAKCEVICANCHLIEHTLYEYDFKPQKVKTTKNRPNKRKQMNKKQEKSKYAPRLKKSNIPDDDTLRKLLFDTPAWELAKQFNCSDSYLSHYCKSRNIDKPSRGYWSKKKLST